MHFSLLFLFPCRLSVQCPGLWIPGCAPLRSPPRRSSAAPSLASAAACCPCGHPGVHVYMTAVTSRRGGEVRRGGRAGNEAEQTSFSSSFQKCLQKKRAQRAKRCVTCAGGGQTRGHQSGQNTFTFFKAIGCAVGFRGKKEDNHLKRQLRVSWSDIDVRYWSNISQTWIIYTMIAGCIQNLPSERSDKRSRGSQKNNILDFCKTAEVEKQNLWLPTTSAVRGGT